MIEKLTDYQVSQLEVYKNKWIKYGLSTEPTNKPESERLIDLIYAEAGLAPPKVKVWAKSPYEGCIIAAKMQYETPTSDQILSQFNSCIYGAHDSGWLSFYDFMIEECGINLSNNIKLLIELAKHCGWIFVYDSTCILTEKPSSLHIDMDGNLHSLKEASCKYGDGFEIYAFHGTIIDKSYIVNPSMIDIDIILEETDTEILRQLVKEISDDNNS